MSDITDRYLDEIGSVPLLSHEEVVELSRSVRAGEAAQEQIEAGEATAALRTAAREGADALDRIMRANLRLVVSLAKRYPVPPGMEFLDLVQEGNLGLRNAAAKYDGDKGFKFSTYAAFWIRQAVSRAIDQKATLIHIPEKQMIKLRQAIRDAGALDQLDAERAHVQRVSRVISLDAPRSVEDATDSFALIDRIASNDIGPEDSTVRSVEAGQLHKALDVLSERQLQAVCLRFGLSDGVKRTYPEVASQLSLTCEGARRLVNHSLKKVREHLTDERELQMA